MVRMVRMVQFLADRTFQLCLEPRAAVDGAELRRRALQPAEDGVADRDDRGHPPEDVDHRQRGRAGALDHRRRRRRAGRHGVGALRQGASFEHRDERPARWRVIPRRAPPNLPAFSSFIQSSNPILSSSSLVKLFPPACPPSKVSLVPLLLTKCLSCLSEKENTREIDPAGTSTSSMKASAASSAASKEANEY